MMINQHVTHFGCLRATEITAKKNVPHRKAVTIPLFLKINVSSRREVEFVEAFWNLEKLAES